MTEITTDMWQALAKIAEHKHFFDERSGNHSNAMKPYDRLVKLGYAAYLNTGPGDSIHEYGITEAGKKALAVHQSSDSDFDVS